MENTITAFRDRFSTRYEITGTAEYVDGQIAHLRSEYPSAGYGTSVRARLSDPSYGVRAIVVRSNSCD